MSCTFLGIYHGSRFARIMGKFQKRKGTREDLNLLRGDCRRKSQKAPGYEAGSTVGCFTVYYCWFVTDVTATMLLDKNKRVVLRWELNSCFVDYHGRLVTWFGRGSE